MLILPHNTYCIRSQHVDRSDDDSKSAPLAAEPESIAAGSSWLPDVQDFNYSFVPQSTEQSLADMKLPSNIGDMVRQLSRQSVSQATLGRH